ncbi:hypothetical protein LCGC14_2122810 [marine sediment metagenome]|uniref:Uncharacterized protein n=1 Tax=marine sediment metagenome TaxID=412755 RepID=A0A0F9E3S6_9ZZZZ
MTDLTTKTAQSLHPMSVRQSHVVSDLYSLDYGFVFDIQSLGELLAYWTERHRRHMEIGFSDFVNSREWKGQSADHVSNGYGQWLAVRVETERHAARPRSLINLLADMNSEVLIHMEKLLSDRERIFIMGSGGYFGNHESLSALETKYTETFTLLAIKTLTEKDIRITQWSGGKHHYVKVGDTELGKWPTWSAAHRHAVEFVRSKESRCLPS